MSGSFESRTYMSGSFESVRWNACVHRLDLSLMRKSFRGMRSEPMLTLREKIPSTGSSEEDWTHDTALHRTASPTHYRLSIRAPERSVETCASAAITATPTTTFSATGRETVMDICSIHRSAIVLGSENNMFVLRSLQMGMIYSCLFSKN